jgi:hypothetical protein
MPFNNSFGKLERLNLWWETAGRAKIENLIEEYYSSLENIYTELYSHLTLIERADIDKKLIEIEKFLDNSNITPGFEAMKAFKVRKASNLCDKLARRLSELSHHYNLEWFDVQKWSKELKDNEKIMQG